MAVDLFHAGWSRVFMPEAIMLLLASLAILQFMRALEKPRPGRFVLLGLLMGLAYLAKEPAILLGPAFWIYLLITPAHRFVLRNRYWYVAHAVFAAVIAPDLLWNASQWTESYLYRDLTMAGQALRISLKPLSLYLGEGFRAVLGSDVLGGDYVEGNIYTCHALAGAIYLAAMAAMAALLDRPAVRCLAVVFLVVFIFFLVLPGGGFYDPFWWASISLIPAVVCAGGWIDNVAGTGHPLAGRVPSAWFRHTKCAYYFGIAVVIAGLGLATALAMMNQGPYEPRASVQDFVDDFLAKGREAFQRGQFQEAEGRFIYVLNIGGPRTDAYCGLAQIAIEHRQPQKAMRLLKKCLALDPKHAGAVELKRKFAKTPAGSPGR
jgi:tetratricopeptide (TPR) repeat protein